MMKEIVCRGFFMLFFVIVLTLSVVAFFDASPVNAQEPYHVFLPILIKSPAYVSSPQAQALALLLENDPGQQHPSLTLNPTLAQVAQARAEDMATRDYFSHIDPDGCGPNYLVRQAGYVLPGYYSTALTANNIESIAAGYGTASAVWNGWMSSPGHKEHLLGQSSFYALQIEYGIGYAYNPSSTYGHYWVIIIAQPGP